MDKQSFSAFAAYKPQPCAGSGTRDILPLSGGPLMKTSSVRALSFASLVLGLALGALPILAHHSFAAEYDDTKPVKFSGVVTKVEWMNPHIWFYVDEKNRGWHGGTLGHFRRRARPVDAARHHERRDSAGNDDQRRRFPRERRFGQRQWNESDVSGRAPGVHCQRGAGFQEELTEVRA